MKYNLKNDVRWRKLDNTAKLFPIISTKKISNIFRLSVVLKDDIEFDILQNSLEITLPNFKSFQVKLKKGFFWHYFEINNNKPIVEKELNYPCKYIDSTKNNGFLFRVSYFKKRINLEVFHSITDGNGAISFLKTLTYNYLSLINVDIKIEKNNYNDVCFFADNEDSYIKNYTKSSLKAYAAEKAFQLKGPKLPFTHLGVIQGHINLEQLLNLCHKKNVTISEYLTTLIIWSIYKENFNQSNSKKPIKVYIPVNLRSFFNSTTNTNFFSFISIIADFKILNINTFDDLLINIKNQFKEKITKENLSKKISTNVAIEKKLLIRLVPLFIKKLGVKIGYFKSKKNHTITLSNLGKIEVLDEFENYIENFSFLLSPSEPEKIKCSMCSYKNNLIFSFNSFFVDTYIQKYFFRYLSSEGIDIIIESNGVNNENL